MPESPFDHLDDLLTRIHVARQRPSWRRRLLDGAGPVTNVSTLRTLRAVEHHQRNGGGASIGDVADYLAVEHSTASRTVSAVVAAGLLAKSSAETVADWDAADIDRLVILLERLTERFEAAAGR
jgi:DNA-binding MarR family transcriptional regulator